MVNYQIIWNKAKEILQNTVSSVNYIMYIENIEAIDMDGSKIVLMTRTSIFASFAQHRLLDKIKEALKKVDPGVTDVEFFVGSSKNDYISTSTDYETEVEGAPVDALNTFDNFVVGTCNSFSCAAAKAIAKDPGNSYNPLFIYGSSGLGKTHLLHAIANEIKKTYPKKKVLYNTCENFFGEFIKIIRSGKAYSENEATSFKNRYRNVDVLIIDDIQFLANKQSSQEEFFHTFNDLYGAKKQIVLSSDRPPRELNLPERLITRFEGGLLTEVLIPDIETKIAILLKKAELKKYILPLDVASYIAELADNNVRSLEGLLNRVILASKLKEQPISLSLTCEALKESVKTENTESVTSTKIIDTVSSYYKIPKSDILSRKRNKEIAEARQICCYLMTVLMAIPLETIGQSVGINYPAVIHARDKITRLISIDDRIATDVNDIKNLILKK